MAVNAAGAVSAVGAVAKVEGIGAVPPQEKKPSRGVVLDATP